MLCKKAHGNNPTSGFNSKDYGWQFVDDILEPGWYAGNSIPDSLSNDDEVSDETPINKMEQMTNTHLNGVSNSRIYHAKCITLYCEFLL